MIKHSCGRFRAGRWAISERGVRSAELEREDFHEATQASIITLVTSIHCPGRDSGTVQERLRPPDIACAAARTPACAGRSSSSTGRRPAPARAGSAVGYWSTVPPRQPCPALSPTGMPMVSIGRHSAASRGATSGACASGTLPVRDASHRHDGVTMARDDARRDDRAGSAGGWLRQRH